MCTFKHTIASAGDTGSSVTAVLFDEHSSEPPEEHFEIEIFVD
jgi:hypothetical protein